VKHVAKGLIAEDEVLLRDALAGLLAEAWPDLEIVAECEDGGSALEALAEHQPDVAFLDIRMPGLSGIEVAQAAAEASPATRIVFVTAYDQYAIAAFEQGAVDYLLKPVAPARLAQTIQRLRARPAPAAAEIAALQDLLSSLRRELPAAPRAQPLVWLTASAGKDTRLVLVDDVLYFRAEHKYTVVVTAEGESLVRKPVRDLLTLLDPDVFKQIHRSTIVNMRAIASISRDDSGRGLARLKGRSESLAISQPFMALFRSM
jgi:DNA-binding LytR/AlgR family response regulator